MYLLWLIYWVLCTWNSAGRPQTYLITFILWEHLQRAWVLLIGVQVEGSIWKQNTDLKTGHLHNCSSLLLNNSFSVTIVFQTLIFMYSFILGLRINSCMNWHDYIQYTTVYTHDPCPSYWCIDGYCLHFQHGTIAVVITMNLILVWKAMTP